MNTRYPLVALGEALRLDIDEMPVDPHSSYDIAGIYSFGRGLFARGRIVGTDTKYKSLNELHAGRLVLSRLKAFEGAVAVVPPEFEGWLLSQEFPTFSRVSELADPRYLDYMCRWPSFWELLASTSKGVGARRERVHPEDLLAIEVPLPDLEEQHRVVRRIDSLLRYSDRIDPLLTPFRNYSNAILHSARTAMVGPAGVTANKKSLGEYREAHLGDLAEFINGTSYESSLLNPDGMPIIRISNISDPTSDLLTTTQDFDLRFMVEPGDLLVSWSASFKSIIWPGPRGILNQHIFRVTELGDNNRHYLRHLIEAVFDSMRTQAVGMGMMHLRRDAFLLHQVLIPGPERQQVIAEHLNRIENKVTEITRRQGRAASIISALRISILNQAFAGLL